MTKITEEISRKHITQTQKVVQSLRVGDMMCICVQGYTHLTFFSIHHKVMIGEKHFTSNSNKHVFPLPLWTT